MSGGKIGSESRQDFRFVEMPKLLASFATLLIVEMPKLLASFATPLIVPTVLRLMKDR
ncbi:hypothetical protein LF1_36130 [Rubripirellula obstinata]|uniref:Uncharacterized protein n=1 Tax=Rubripirellula obstinata TaxID=406547 RepID=A0A5B1CMQ3_9BACT|nr:hypothetical protein LF1_36130 [Rubripirellula obstinata]